MNYFRRKPFHNSTSSKDHYLLPDENQKDHSQSNPSDEQSQPSQPHQTLIINNFSDNAKIKIDILYDDPIKVHKTQSSIPIHFVNQTNLSQSSPRKKLAFDNRANSRLGVFDGDSAHPPTPIKTPKYNYRHAYDPITDNIQTPIHTFSNHGAQVKIVDSKQNVFYDERRNQRYFNTQVLFPYPSILKTPQTAAQRQQNTINYDKERTPFPEKSLENDKRDILREKRLEISQRLKNRSLFIQPKEKSFYKVPQFNLNESMNRVDQNKQNQAQNDKPFEVIAQFEVVKEEQKDKVSVERPFIVREQISEDFLQDKNEQAKKRQRLVHDVKSSGCIESEIAEEVQHDNSFFDKVKPHGQIEDLIIPSYNIEKDKYEENQNQDAHVWFEEPVIKEQKCYQKKQQNEEQENPKNNDQLKNQDGPKQVSANQSLNTDQQSQYLNQSHPELNSLNVLQIQNQHYFPTQIKDNQIESHPESYQQNIAFENHNIQPEKDQSFKTEIQVERQLESQKEEVIKELPLVSAGKWNKQRSSQILDVRQYSTRPKTTQIVQVDNHEQRIAYPLDQTPNQQVQNHEIQGNQEQEQQSSQQDIILKREQSQPSHINKSNDSINELSQIQKQSPRKDFDRSQIKQHIQNYQEKPQQEQFYQKYDATEEIHLTNKKSPLSLKFESVISYTISPSPKNIKFTQSIKKTFKKQHQLQQLSIKSSDKLSLTSSIQNSQSRSRSRDSPKTYQKLQKYKRLFKKQTNKSKNLQIQLSNQTQRQRETSKVNYSEIHKPQGYSQRSSMMRNQEFIKVEHNNNDEYPVNDTPKSRQKIKNYFTEDNSFDQIQNQKPRFSYPRNQQLHKQESESKLQRSEWIRPKVVKVNLQDKTAQDLFTKHKDEFLNKLKRKEKHQQSTVQYRSTSKSNQKPIYTKLTFPNTTQNSQNPSNYQSTRNRPLSPYIQNLTNRLSSSNPKQYICGHYKKHSRRDLRAKFMQLLENDDRIMLRKYYFSQDEINQIFIEEILGKEINEIYWVEVLKNYGERKLENIRLKAKANFHPFEKTIVRHQQLLADAKRTYGFYEER